MRSILALLLFFAALVCFSALTACGDDGGGGPDSGTPDAGRDSATAMDAENDAGPGDAGSDGGAPDGGGPDGGTVAAVCAVDDGECIFRHETFGNEQLWTDVLRLHEVVQTLPPTMALAVGLKVDATAVPAEVLASADLEDPATTVALLDLDAVVGVRAEVSDGTITRIGINCALCHSDVDDSVAEGIGARLDGHANRDLDPGLIISLTPGLPDLAASLGVDAETARAALASWGAGRYDARFNQDAMSDPVMIPPAYGLEGVELETYTGDGPVSYWNAYVAITQMGGHGNFEDDRIGVDIRMEPDLVTPRLPALLDYQLGLLPPAPPEGSFDAAAAARGATVFAARCASCHAGSARTDAPTLHAPAEIGADPTHAERSATGMYRTTPLRGLWHRPPYFHDGSAATLADVVTRYETTLGFTLTEPERTDLVQYLLSL
jgi:mono/diheme cytochrome c family protein